MSDHRSHLRQVLENRAGPPVILSSAALSLAAYAILARSGDLRAHPEIYLPIHGLLVGLMLLGWRALRHHPRMLRWALGAALAFRLVAALGAPALSDDVYRYVWDGRLQAHGVHPYRYAPADPELESLRDEHWPRINHPGLRTIYPPLSQLLFAALAAAGAGPLGFKLALGLLDFGVVLLLWRLLGALKLPAGRLLLYAWNPLAVVETAGSGHVEPLGLLFLLAATLALVRWRPAWSASALAAAVQVKLLPLALFPAILRRVRNRDLLLFFAVLALLALPYALSGPALGAGLIDYAQRWERNALLFPALRRALEWQDLGPWLKSALDWSRERIGDGLVPWGALYRHVWPGDLARLAVGLAALGWLVALSLRRGLGVAREFYLALAGVLLLSPTLHPWYVLWVLPFAAAFAAPGWLAFAALVPLSYLAGSGEVSWGLRAVQYAPLIGAGAWWLRGRMPRSPLPPT